MCCCLVAFRAARSVALCFSWVWIIFFGFTPASPRRSSRAVRKTEPQTLHLSVGCCQPEPGWQQHRPCALHLSNGYLDSANAMLLWHCSAGRSFGQSLAPPPLACPSPSPPPGAPAHMVLRLQASTTHAMYTTSPRAPSPAYAPCQPLRPPPPTGGTELPGLQSVLDRQVAAYLQRLLAAVGIINARWVIVCVFLGWLFGGMCDVERTSSNALCALCCAMGWAGMG